MWHSSWQQAMCGAGTGSLKSTALLRTAPCASTPCVPACNTCIYRPCLNQELVRRAGGGANGAGLSRAAMARVRAARALVSPQRARRGAAARGRVNVSDSEGSESEPDAGSDQYGSLSGAESGGEEDLGGCSHGALGLLRLASGGAPAQSQGYPGPKIPNKGPGLTFRRARSEGSPWAEPGGSDKALVRDGAPAADGGGGACPGRTGGVHAPAVSDCRASPARMAGARRPREHAAGAAWWSGAGDRLTPDFGGFVPRGKRTRRGPAAPRAGAAAEASAAPSARAQVRCWPVRCRTFASVCEWPGQRLLAATPHEDQGMKMGRKTKHP